MLESVLDIPFWLELVATLTGAITGSMHAVRRRYDVCGVVCISVINGLAGGIMRDILLQDYGIYAFQKPSLIVTCAVVGILVFYFGKLISYLDPAIDVIDNVSVALWAIIGAGKGMSAGLDIVPGAIMGTLTAVGGGIVRDVCMNRTPETFQAGSFYGLAAFFGSLAYALMAQSELLEDYAAVTCVVLIIALRYASLLFGWRTSAPHDFSDEAAEAVARPFEWLRRRMPERGRGMDADERAALEARRRASYERLRRFWRAPGKTSPLPRVKEGNAGDAAGADAGTADDAPRDEAGL